MLSRQKTAITGATKRSRQRNEDNKRAAEDEKKGKERGK